MSEEKAGNLKNAVNGRDYEGSFDRKEDYDDDDDDNDATYGPFASFSQSGLSPSIHSSEISLIKGLSVFLPLIAISDSTIGSPRRRGHKYTITLVLSWALLSRDQGFYSSSPEACQDHQKLNSFTPFPSFTALSTNSIL